MVNERTGTVQGQARLCPWPSAEKARRAPRARAQREAIPNKDASRKSHLSPVSAAGGLFLRSSDNTL